MTSMGKKRRDAAQRFDRTAHYPPAEAVGLVKALAAVNLPAEEMLLFYYNSLTGAGKNKRKAVHIKKC